MKKLKDKSSSVLLWNASASHEAILVNPLAIPTLAKAVAAKTADGSGMEHTMSWVPAGHKNLRNELMSHMPAGC